ncbi:MAG TPA: hypothetical protein VLS96_10440, partial [Nodosilinea sp.]|nr:hypothetical protein [Nodosilinea sp.]
VPCVASAVGGSPTVLRADINGKAFPLAATALDYAQYIADTMADRARDQQLCLSAWQHYRRHLSWDAAQQQAWGYLQELAAPSRGIPMEMLTGGPQPAAGQSTPEASAPLPQPAAQP